MPLESLQSYNPEKLDADSCPIYFGESCDSFFVFFEYNCNSLIINQKQTTKKNNLYYANQNGYDTVIRRRLNSI
jgi:hypothetical protein